MGVNEKSREGFLGRWSRRKRAPAAARVDEPRSADAQSADATAREETFANLDFASLDFASDYRRFMANAVPDHVRNRALRQLWSSSDLIAEPDELDEFREDFRDEAKAIPAALARSAYRIGRGFIDDEPEMAMPDGESEKAVRDDMSGERTRSDRQGVDDTTEGDTTANETADTSDRRRSTRG